MVIRLVDQSAYTKKLSDRVFFFSNKCNKQTIRQVSCQGRYPPPPLSSSSSSILSNFRCITATFWAGVWIGTVLHLWSHINTYCSLKTQIFPLVPFKGYSGSAPHFLAAKQAWERDLGRSRNGPDWQEIWACVSRISVCNQDKSFQFKIV